MLNQDLIEKEYPQRAEIAYFNTSAIALPPVSVKKAVKGYIDALSDTFCHNAATFHNEILEGGRKELAKLLDCSPVIPVTESHSLRRHFPLKLATV